MLIDEVVGWRAGLDDLLARFAHRFGRTEPRQQALTYPWLGHCHRWRARTVGPLAAAASDVTLGRMRRLLNRSAWDPDAGRDDRLAYVGERLGDNGGVLLVLPSQPGKGSKLALIRRPGPYTGLPRALPEVGRDQADPHRSGEERKRRGSGAGSLYRLTVRTCAQPGLGLGPEFGRIHPYYLGTFTRTPTCGLRARRRRRIRPLTADPTHPTDLAYYLCSGPRGHPGRGPDPDHRDPVGDRGVLPDHQNRVGLYHYQVRRYDASHRRQYWFGPPTPTSLVER